MKHYDDFLERMPREEAGAIERKVGVTKGKNKRAPGDFYPPVPPPERPVSPQMKHQGAALLSLPSPGRRLGISNAKLHNGGESMDSFSIKCKDTLCSFKSKND